MKQIEELLQRRPVLQQCSAVLQDTVTLLSKTFSGGGKLLVCGNGGSCADAEHIVGELMKSFLLSRALPQYKKEEMRKKCPQVGEPLLAALQGALPAIALTGAPALSTAFANDVRADAVFAQQVYGYARPGDALLCISTSGNAANVCAAALTAKAMGVSVIGLTGLTGGKLLSLADLCICVPEKETYRVQELHLPVYHALCAQLETIFFGESLNG